VEALHRVDSVECTATSAPLGRDTIVSSLAELKAACEASETVFLRAYRDVAFDEELRTVFRRYAEQRSAFGLVLAVRLQALGGHATPHAAVGAGGLVDATETIDVDVSVSVLAACIVADSALTARYREICALPLPTEIHAEVEREMLAVIDAHDHLESLERAFRARARGVDLPV
jgi:hypothetical protein